MNEPDFPRVLVVTSNNFNLVNGGGITLTNLFRGWPPDRLANLHEDPMPEDHSVCRNFYRLSAEEIRWVWPLSLVQAWDRPERLAPMDGRSVERDRASGAPGRIRHSILAPVVRSVVGDGLPRTVRISPALARWLDGFKPDLLYGFLGSMAQIRLTRLLAREMRLPVGVHIMDDWPAVLYTRGLLGPLLRRIVLREFDEVLRMSTLRLGISDAMCEEYRRRYGYSFRPFHNAIDMNEWLAYARGTWKARSPFSVRYVGSIVADGQRQGLRDVCETVVALRASGEAVDVWVHAPRDQSAYLAADAFARAGVHLEGPPTPERVPELLTQADLLVLPFNFDSRSARYIRLSMPTKVPAYMASGTPVLVYGPPGIATVDYATRDRWAYTVSSGGVPALQTALKRLMRDEAMREALGRRAVALARKHHDAGRVRETFREALASATRRQAGAA